MAELYDQNATPAEPDVEEGAEQRPGRIQRMRERAAKVQRTARQGIALVAEIDDRLQHVGRKQQPAKFDKVKLERPQAAEPIVAEPSMAEHAAGPAASEPQLDPRDVRIRYDEMGRPVLSRIDDAAEAPTQQLPTVEHDLSL